MLQNLSFTRKHYEIHKKRGLCHLHLPPQQEVPTIVSLAATLKSAFARERNAGAN